MTVARRYIIHNISACVLLKHQVICFEYEIVVNVKQLKHIHSEQIFIIYTNTNLEEFVRNFVAFTGVLNA